MDPGRRACGGLVLPTLLAAVSGGVAVLVTVLAAGAALQPDAAPPRPAVAEVRPPEPLDAPLLHPAP